MTAIDQRAPTADDPTVQASAAPAEIVANGSREIAAAHLIELAADSGAAGDCLCFEDEIDGAIVVAPLVRDRTRVGRGLAADVLLDDPTVSRRHALIVRTAGAVTVLDERSLNGVVVNGRRVTAWRLEHGDEIQLGRRRLCFARLAGPGELAGPAERAGATVARVPHALQPA